LGILPREVVSGRTPALHGHLRALRRLDDLLGRLRAGRRTLNLFAQNDTDNHFFGIAYPASWLQSPQAAFIVALAPVFAWLWLKLGRRDPSSPTKFALAWRSWASAS